MIKRLSKLIIPVVGTAVALIVAVSLNASASTCVNISGSTTTCGLPMSTIVVHK